MTEAAGAVVTKKLIESIWDMTGGLVGRKVRESRDAWDPRTLHLWNLVPHPWNPLGAAIDPTKLLAAVNANGTKAGEQRPSPPKALRFIAPFKEQPWKAERFWGDATDDINYARTALVLTTRDGVTVDRVRELRDRLSTAAPGDAAHTVVRSKGRGGKTVFIHKLFLDMLDGADRSMPMLVSRQDVELMRDRGPLGEDAIRAFVGRWLDVHHVTTPAKARKELLNEFASGLRSGSIVLLVDGVDPLNEIGADAMLSGIKRWVVAWNEAEGKPSGKVTLIELESFWDEPTIAAYLDWRIPDASEPRKIASREALKRVIKEMTATHELERKARHSEEKFWLAQPSNLHLFVNRMIADTPWTERQIREDAANPGRMVRDILDDALDRTGQAPQMAAISGRLFHLASRDSDASDSGTSEIDRRVLRLTDIVRNVQGRPEFRQSVYREYFRCGLIAREIEDPDWHDSTGEAFKPTTWVTEKRAAIVDCFESQATGAMGIRRLLSGAQVADITRRNLLELLITVERRRDRESQAGDSFLHGLDCSGMSLAGIVLSDLVVRNCVFERSVLHTADLSGSTFDHCKFAGADFSDSDAYQAKFSDCAFGAAALNTQRMVISGASFESGGKAFTPKWEGVIDSRSRYAGEFGKRWAAFQKAALPGLGELEENAYIPEISRAIQAQGDRNVYLVDLMAGGTYRRVFELLEKFDRLHILGIDRDKAAFEDFRLDWQVAEIGNGPPDDPLGLSIRELLTKRLQTPPGAADIVIGKKAIHEIPRDLQQKLFKEVFASLRPGGKFILLADCNGPDKPEEVDERALAEVHAKIDGLRSALRPANLSPEFVTDRLEMIRCDGSPLGLLEFANSWIAVKDWANRNRRECARRYFACPAEIRQWAKDAEFEFKSIETNPYRLNPLYFNEIGLGLALEYLEREGSKRSRSQVVKTSSDRDELCKLIDVKDQDRLPVLVEFTRSKLEGQGADQQSLRNALGASPAPLDLSRFDEDLATLPLTKTAWAFNLSCHVFVFEKPM
jgi:uncharacterized protein YjbI with pentapeptide repeats